MPPRPFSLLLVRHGQSEWNAVRRWQGLADSRLTDLGMRQADEVAAALARHPRVVATVWSSDLSRASETAWIIAAELGIADVRIDSRLREADAGPWQGLTPEEIERRWPGHLEEHRRPDGFEPADSVVERAIAVCREILRELATDSDAGTTNGDEPGAASFVTAVTHSGLIRALRRHLGGPDERIPNLGGIWLGLGTDDDDLQLGPMFSALGRGLVGGVDGAGEDPGDETDQRHECGGGERSGAR